MKHNFKQWWKKFGWQTLGIIIILGVVVWAIVVHFTLTQETALRRIANPVTLMVILVIEVSIIFILPIIVIVYGYRKAVKEEKQKKEEEKNKKENKESPSS